MGKLRSIRSAACWLALLAWLACGHAGAQVAAQPAEAATARDFRQVGLTRRFQTEVITEVLRDRVGFLWIGTREGLYLHDGQRFRKFEHGVQDDGSLSSNGVRSLLEDSHGRLWVATITGGLNLLDRAHWRFRHWRTGAGDRGPSHDGVFALVEAEGGRLWVGTQAGLDLFDPATDRFRRVPLAEGGEFVMSLLRDRRGRLWVATLGQGLHRSDDGGRSFQRVPRAGGVVEPDDIFTLAEDARGRVWVGARDGLFVVGGNGKLQAAELAPASTADTLVNVTEIEPMADGGLWVGTFGVGLYRVDPDGRTIEYVPLGVDGPPGQHVDQGALALDAHGGLFVGTFGRGLLHMRGPSLAIRHWSERGPDGARLTNEDVYVVRPDGVGGAWLGTFGGGIDHLAMPSGRIEPLELPAGADADEINGVLDLDLAPDGTLWVATSSGVYRYHPETHAFRRYLHPDTATAYGYSMLRDRAGRLWVGTGGGGLMLYRPARDDFALFRPDPDDPHSLSDDFVTVLMEDRRGRLWVGTRSGGANICSLLGERLACERIPADGGGLALSHYHVSALLEAPDGSVLVGTAGGGLDFLALGADGRVAAVELLTRSDGLMDDNVMALAYAPDGALWVSTRGGFSHIAGERVDNYGPADGLPTTVFNPKAVAGIGGRLYWGTQQGLLAIDPSALPQRNAAPPTVIASIEGLPDGLQPATPAWRTEGLEVPMGQPFSLEFAVLGYDGGDPEYEYRLGESEPWTELDDRGQLTMHALAPGRYDLQVRGRRGGSAWTSAAPLRLSIVPPWWRQPLVQALALLVLLVALLGAFGWHVRGLRRSNRELQRSQHQRGEALEAARASREQMEQAFTDLRRLTMRLEAAKEEERKYLARELHDEFGQALTAAKINLRLALVDPAAPGADERIAETVQLVERLIAQVRALSFDLRPPLLDEMGLAPALEGHLNAAAHRSGLPIDVAIAPDLPPLGIEREIMVFRIVQEAVTNALRHAGASSLDVSLAATPGGIAIDVRDDGSGFDAAAVMDDGSGFGLFGMRERVHELGGSFLLESAPGQGTRVSALIPVEPHPAMPEPGRQGERHARRAG